MSEDGAWLQTYTNRKFYPLNPSMGDISIVDIAHSLSNINRYLGASRYAYSVAQHSVLVSKVVPPQYALWGLLHDASEAYLGDVPAPLKHTSVFKEYRDCEDWLMELIARKYGLIWPMPPCVKLADMVLLVTEARDIMAPRHPDWVVPPDVLPLKETIYPVSAIEAETSFLYRFDELTRPISNTKEWL